MKTVTSSDLASLISSASSIAGQLREYIVQGKYEEADEISMEYGEAVESILNYPASSLTELKLKIGFIFDDLLVEADSEEALLKYKTIIENDLTVLNRT